MDNLIEDAKEKGLITFEKRQRWIIYGNLLSLKDFNKLPQTFLAQYWKDYLTLHGGS
jgi:hypothetical protein